MPAGGPAAPRGVGAIVVAAGQGHRFGALQPKQFVDLCGMPVLAWSVRTLVDHPDIDRVVVVLAPQRAASPPAWLPDGVLVVPGGVFRADSVRAGAAALAGNVETVLVHDGARPFVSAELVSRVANEARNGPVVPAVAVEDTVKRVDEGGWIQETVPRERLRRVQTPQGFPVEVLRRTHALDDADAWEAQDHAALTDDALLCERLGIDVSTVEGDAANLKITTARDLALARAMVETGLIAAGN
ncbi:MAG: 2-C-methyl-D-erythritol 4-phosphate cytidylyltransferase [Gemmatimonadales bacterium]|nr:2-C-methyl-D-erythritol 4-phosphate cytidylyltransferase [Gemmatimonadales bacterium]MYG48435.1 2-C-methyl-D-erythritol 4-phosphate cytidylyltransferase [Gemmatimonadales bacterium]MYK00351.1 2-C-methyl-D-erythritol 4-phosphate cytidylyltransferase [Candidatus Palauibacter ramosifaciens]